MQMALVRLGFGVARLWVVWWRVSDGDQVSMRNGELIGSG